MACDNSVPCSGLAGYGCGPIDGGVPISSVAESLSYEECQLRCISEGKAITNILGIGLAFWYPEPLHREKGSGKSKCINLETYVRPVHFQGHTRNEKFKWKTRSEKFNLA